MLLETYIKINNLFSLKEILADVNKLSVTFVYTPPHFLELIGIICRIKKAHQIIWRTFTSIFNSNLDFHR
jgi:hypothetical protein